MNLLKQSTARNTTVFMTSSADHVTGATGLTLTITASKDGAAFSSISPTVTELANGWYSLALTTSHTDTLGDFTLHITGTAADPTDMVGQVVLDLPGATVSSVTGAVGSVTGNVSGSVASVVGAVGSVTGNVGGNVVGTVASVVGAVGSVTGNVGGSVASVTGNVGGNIVGTVASVVGAVGSVTGNVGGSVASVTAGVTVTTNNDKTGYALSSAGVQAIWDALTSALTTVGSIGKLLVTNINSAVGSVAGAVWDIALSGHLTSGSTGAALNAAGGAGDPWATVLPGVYGAGTAGNIIGNNVDATISSRLATSGYTAPDNSDIAAIKVKTDNLPANPASQTNLDVAVSSRLATSGYTAPDNADITAIKAKTDNLPLVPASQGDVTTVGTAVSSLSTKVGTPAGASVSADIAQVETNVLTRAVPGDAMDLAAAQVPIKKNMALNGFTFPMFNSSGALATGLTVTAQRSLDGGTFANCANAVVEIGGGYYKINLAASDLNANVIALSFTATGVLATSATLVTQ